MSHLFEVCWTQVRKVLMKTRLEKMKSVVVCSVGGTLEGAEVSARGQTRAGMANLGTPSAAFLLLS